MDVEDGFIVTEEDEYAIEIARAVARRLLANAAVTPQQVIGLGKALQALEDMPRASCDVSIEFGVTLRTDSGRIKGMEYCDFRISDEVFEISRGGSDYDERVGGDSYSLPGWSLELDGASDQGCLVELADLENQVQELLNLGAEITVTDDMA